MALWNDSFATGNQMVDDDHKSIFMLVENVLSSSYVDRADKIETAINFLTEYVVRHFANEEKLMDESNYPGSSRHKQEHADFLAVAGELKKKFDSGGFMLGEHSNDLHLSVEINKTVVGWLTKHVMESDLSLAEHYRTWSEK